MQKTITIKVKTEVEEIITINFPAFYTNGNSIYKLDEDAIIQVGKSLLFLTLSTGMFYQSELETIIKYEPSTDAGFMNAYNEYMSLISPLVNNAKCITLQD